jgi:hypothetical protein
MSNTKQKGSAAVEMIHVVLFFLLIIGIVHSFSMLSDKSHALSVNLQNKVEQKMIDAGRPPCLLEDIGERIVRGKIAPAIFGEGKIEKGLVFVTRSTCPGESI